ncbi:hypothetical protein UT300003_20460 [Clostridium sardiniense]
MEFKHRIIVSYIIHIDIRRLNKFEYVTEYKHNYSKITKNEEEDRMISVGYKIIQEKM